MSLGPKYWDGQDSANESKASPTSTKDLFHPLNIAKGSTESDEDSNQPWSEVIQQFCQKTTLHGMNKVVESSPFICRKVFWLCLVLTGLGLFSFQVVDRVMYYVTYPVTVNVKINYNDTLRFPVVTICNQNAFRITAAASRGYYYWLDDLYSQSNIRNFDYQSHMVGDVSRFDLFSQTAHNKADMIYQCYWDGQPCSADNFTTVFTDHGVCYSFNTGKEQPALLISQTGANRGLQLKLNVEQYEYMRGPQDAAGLKILLHDQQEIPFVQDLGEAIPTGSNAFVGISVLQVDNLPLPHGDCVASKPLQYYDYYSLSACKRDCMTRFVVEQCGCADFYMPLTNSCSGSRCRGGPDECTVEDYINCVVTTLERYQQLLQENAKSVCECPVPCSTTHYQGTTSYATITSRNTHQLLHDNRSHDLAIMFVAARETEQRLDKEIIQHDFNLITSLQASYDDIIDMMERLLYAGESLQEAESALIEDIQPRARFHFNTGVNKTNYIAEHDFSRGFEVMDERTIRHTTTGYTQMIEAFRDMVNISLSSMDDPVLRQTYYIVTKRDLQARYSLASRALDNMTEVHEGFYNGTPILTYEASPDRRYDMSYISINLLRFHPAEKEYAELLLNYFRLYKGYLEQLMVINTEIYKNATVDTGNLERLLERVAQRSRNINYNRFRYQDRIVMGLKEQAQAIVDNFVGLNQTLHSRTIEFERALNSVQNTVNGFQESTWQRISKVVAHAANYLQNKNISKISVAEMLESAEMLEDMRATKTFFVDIRLLAQQAEDRWMDIKRAFDALWRGMLENIHLEQYYKMIHEDVSFIISSNDSERQYLLGVLSEHAGIEKDLVSNMSIDQLNSYFNADFATMNKSLKYTDIAALFDDILASYSPVQALRADGDVFIDNMDALQTNMKEYLDSTVITSSFYQDNFLDLNVYMKELSYEEIQQQEAYDLIALLSDIGGSMGLFIGASVITVFELFDMMIHEICKRHCA